MVVRIASVDPQTLSTAAEHCPAVAPLCGGPRASEFIARAQDFLRVFQPCSNSIDTPRTGRPPPLADVAAVTRGAVDGAQAGHEIAQPTPPYRDYSAQARALLHCRQGRTIEFRGDPPGGVAKLIHTDIAVIFRSPIDGDWRRGLAVALSVRATGHPAHRVWVNRPHGGAHVHTYQLLDPDPGR